jgi:hypothetical protein
MHRLGRFAVDPVFRSKASCASSIMFHNISYANLSLVLLRPVQQMFLR